jgi:hemerythrin superfamily protein
LGVVSSAGDQDVVDLLIDQHKQMKSLFSRVSAARGAEKQERFEDLVRLLAVHETAEEEVVHPVARRKIENGEKVTDARLLEENALKKALSDLHDLGVDHPDFAGRLATLAGEVVDHSTYEENEEFTPLRRAVTDKQLRKMAETVRAAEATAPTRPHPVVGTSPVANMLAGPPLAVFDRVRDSVRGWRREHGDSG